MDDANQVRIQVWEAAKAALAQAQADERAARQAVIDGFPELNKKLGSDEMRTDRVVLSDGRYLTVRRQHNYRIISSRKDFKAFIDTLSADHAAVVETKYSINRTKFRALPLKVRELFCDHVFKSVAMNHLSCDTIRDASDDTKSGG